MAFSTSKTTKYIKHKVGTAKQGLSAFISRRPLAAFFSLLGILLILILIGSWLRQPPETSEITIAEPKPVKVYSSAQMPSMTFSATIEKSGVINIYAQTPGIVQALRVKEGDRVKRGQSLVNLSTNYQGGNVASVSRQIAQKSYNSTVENFDAQMDIIAKQKDLANKGNIQAEEMRDINRKSLEDTRSLITLNQDIIGRINANLDFLNSTNVGGANDAAILGAMQGKAGAQSGLNQLQSGLRTLEYQSSNDSTGADLGEISRDVTLKQLELQEKSLTLAKDISGLNLKLARISESLMYPATPVPGVVERVNVKIGQAVNPGTLIATIKADTGENTAVVSVTRDVSKQISMTEGSQLLTGDKSITLLPRYISTEATTGNLYTVLYDIPAEYASLLTNTELLQMRIPLGSSLSSGEVVMVPLDAVYQTQTQAYLTVVRQNAEGQAVAKTIEVELGAVSGSFVEVISGITAEDQVITSRNVQDADLVKIQE